MAPTIKKDSEAKFKIFFVDGSTEEIVADVLSEPNNTAEDTKFFVFERSGEIIAKFRQGLIKGWRIVS